MKEAEEQRRSGVPGGGKGWSVRARSLEPWSSLYAYYCFDSLVPLRRVSSSLDGSVNGSRLAITGFAGLCEAPRRLGHCLEPLGGWQPNGTRDDVKVENEVHMQDPHYSLVATTYLNSLQSSITSHHSN